MHSAEQIVSCRKSYWMARAEGRHSRKLGILTHKEQVNVYYQDKGMNTCLTAEYLMCTDIPKIFETPA